MKYLEKFEGFLLTESVEEAKKKIEVELSSKLEDMTQDEKNKLYSDLNNVSQKLGLSMEEMKDAKLVAKKLQELAPNSHNENIFTRGWDYIKNNYNTLMMKIGFSSWVASALVMFLKSVLENHHPQGMLIPVLASMISFLVMSIGAMGYVAGLGRGVVVKRKRSA